MSRQSEVGPQTRARVAARVPPVDADPVRVLVDRYDPSAYELRRSRRLIAVDRDDRRTVVEVTPWGAEAVGAAGRRCDTVLAASGSTWSRLALDMRDGLGAFRSGSLRIRGDLNAALGFLSATAASRDPSRLRVRCVETRAGDLSVLEAGAGEPVVLVHGLGGTKASFLPTLDALAPRFHMFALDLPGFGDSAKPIGAPYDAPYFARCVLALLDALGIRRAHVLGHSLGGRVALELGSRHPERVASLSLLMPSMPWLRRRAWAPLLRLVRPELGLLQVAPRTVVDGVVRRLVPGASSGWLATGIDEFLRAYCDPRGRAAFYAAARNIYLEEGVVAGGLWGRLCDLDVPAMFVWGRRDTLVPVAFARHVDRALPCARHVFLDSGHVPQFEAPGAVHGAVAAFLSDNPLGGGDVVDLRGRRAAPRARQRPVA